ncbi:hypothetical protein ABZW18_30350 [Streptomyces sp. NPDC004647]|uniref:hypothetical protein n=1 Tax=Streptomyces sp. NPDC004647 TaxID=3154671 RepID=UPI0033AC8029
MSMPTTVTASAAPATLASSAVKSSAPRSAVQQALAPAWGMSAPASAHAANDPEQPMGESRAAGQCTFGRLCGRVHNGDNRIDLLITNQWYYRHQSWTWRVLKPGQDGSNVGVKDVDGLWVGPGCQVKAKIRDLLPRPRTYNKTFGYGWHKVKDDMNVKVYETYC